MTYPIGQGLYVTVNLSNLSGAPADPASLLAKVRQPSGKETTFTYGTDAVVEKMQTGVYRMHVRLDAPGTWAVRFVPQGNEVETPIEVTVEADKSRFKDPI